MTFALKVVIATSSLDIVIQGLDVRMDVLSPGISTIALIRGDDNVLVDTGHFGTRRYVLDYLKRLGLSPSDIDRVILTHSHWDHALNLGLFTDATVVINSKELTHARSVTGDDLATPLSVGMMLERMRIQSTTGDQDLSHNISVIETPGHSPGHQAVLVRTEAGSALFTGDAMSTMRSYLRGVPDFVTATEEVGRRSISRIKELKPDTYYPGHDRPFRIVNGRPEYIAHSELKVFFGRETEEDFGMVLRTADAEKPTRI